MLIMINTNTKIMCDVSIIKTACIISITKSHHIKPIIFNEGDIKMNGAVEVSKKPHKMLVELVEDAMN